MPCSSVSGTRQHDQPAQAGAIRANAGALTTKGLGVTGFQPLWQRWKAERTLAWLGRSRRLTRDYETAPRSQESQIYWTMTGIMLRRVTDTSPVTTYRTTPETPLPASI